MYVFRCPQTQECTALINTTTATPSHRRVSPTALSPQMLLEHVQHALDTLKGQDIVCMDVRQTSNVTDYLLVVSGTSTRHVQAVAEEVILRAKHIGNPPIGVEGEHAGEWILVDLGDVIVHVMLPRVRELYALERLWSVAETSAFPHTTPDPTHSSS